MTYQILNGNSLELLKTLEDNSIDAIVTDPPYGLSQHSQADIVNALTAWLAGEEYTHGKGGFMGKACMLEGMRFIGMELSEEYAKIAQARIEYVYNQARLLHA